MKIKAVEQKQKVQVWLWWRVGSFGHRSNISHVFTFKKSIQIRTSEHETSWPATINQSTALSAAAQRCGGIMTKHRTRHYDVTTVAFAYPFWNETFTCVVARILFPSALQLKPLLLPFDSFCFYFLLCVVIFLVSETVWKRQR